MAAIFTRSKLLNEAWHNGVPM